MTSRGILMWTLAIALLLSGRAWAQALAPITVPVADQSTPTREAALRVALDLAVSRLAGAEAAQSFWIAPSAVLTSYQYRRAAPASVGQPAPLELLVRFDETALAAALRQSGHAVWDGPRPPLLAWIHSPQGWLDQVDAARLAPELLATLQQWGYSLRFPQLDMAERRTVVFEDLVAGFTQDWQRACAAYGMNWCLAIDLQPVPPAASPAAPPDAASTAQSERSPQWVTRWVLADEERVQRQLQIEPMDMGAATQAALLQLNGVLLAAHVERTAMATTNDWEVQLEGLQGSGAYLQALAHLRGAGISAQVRRAAPQLLVLRVAWRGTPRDWRRQTQDWGWVEVPLLDAAPLNTAEMPADGTFDPASADTGSLSGFAQEPAAQTRFRYRVPAP